MTNPPAQTIARALLEIDAVVFSPEKPVTFKSGIISPVYVDNRRVPYHPAAWAVVLDGFAAAIGAHGLAYDVIAGIAVGGVPHSAALAYRLGKPSVFVRKEAKGHGTMSRIEGGPVDGRRVLLVEDLVTTGGSSLAGVAALREAGADVAACLAIMRYGFPEAEAAFQAAEVRLLALADFDALLAEARALGKLTPQQADLAAGWAADPHGWAARHGLA